MGRRARVHSAVGGAAGFRYEKVHLLDPQAQVRGVAMYQVRGELDRRRDERECRQCGRGGCQGFERPREGRAIERRVQQLVPIANATATHGPLAI